MGSKAREPTLFKRRDALVENGWVTPTRVAQRVYYSAQDVHIMDCMHFWATKAYNLTEVIHHLRRQESAYKNGGAALEEDENTFEPLASKSLLKNPAPSARIGQLPIR